MLSCCGHGCSQAVTLLWRGLAGGGMGGRLFISVRGLRAALPPRGLGLLEFPSFPAAELFVLGCLCPTVGFLSLLVFQKAPAFLCPKGTSCRDQLAGFTVPFP